MIGIFYDKSNAAEHALTVIKSFIYGINKTSIYEFIDSNVDKYDLVITFGAYANLVHACNKLNIPIIIIDYGFLRRGRIIGYYKVSINHWYPNSYFQKIKHSGKRFSKLGINITPMQAKSGFLLLAGIGRKSSEMYNIDHQSWDIETAAKIKKLTDKRIVYRPRHTNDKSIKGTRRININNPLNKVLESTSSIIAYSSNITIDGLIKGIPCFMHDGVGISMGLNDISLINTPKIVDYQTQLQFFYDLAHTQWTLNEIKTGKCWKHILNENLI